MANLNSLVSAINSVERSSFDELAIAVFNYQAKENRVFKAYLEGIGHSCQAASISELAFMPIELFKNHTIKTGDWQEETVFESSGTTGIQTSRHYVRSLKDYQVSTVAAFEECYGSLEQYTILALLPSYIERGNSGLIAMVDHFITLSQSEDSGYYLQDVNSLLDKLLLLRERGSKTLLWGVTFGLLDFVEKHQIDFPELIVMETGGMKGRRDEMLREEVHHLLKRAFHVQNIHSEYGMTELSSQAYSKGLGLFEPSRTMRALSRDINDPFEMRSYGKTGALNIIDLQNIYSCSFIETKDLGRVYENGTFEVMGRMDNSDIRGCNLMVL